MFERLAVERIVASGRRPGQRLQLRVAHVLDPLSLQIAHERVLRARLERPPAGDPKLF